MESQPSTAKRSLVAVVVVLVVVAAVGVGAVVYYANRGRKDQLHTDEMGRQRDVVNADLIAKEKMAKATTQMTAVTQPAAK